MKDDFLTTDSVAKNLSGKEEVIGKMEAKPLDDNDPGSGYLHKSNRVYCANCKKGSHNSRDNDTRCKGKNCECRCRTHYVGRDGKPRPYGIEDDSFTKEPKTKFSPESDAEIAELMEEFHNLHKNDRKSREDQPTPEPQTI